MSSLNLINSNQNNLLHTVPRWAVTLGLHYGVANAEWDICSQNARDIRFEFGGERYKRKEKMKSPSRSSLLGSKHSNYLPSFQSLVNMSSPSEQIAAHPFFTADVSALPFDERIALAYQRAILILRTYSMLPVTASLSWAQRLTHTHRLDG